MYISPKVGPEIAHRHPNHSWREGVSVSPAMYGEILQTVFLRGHRSL